MTENNAGKMTKILSPKECLSLLKNFPPAFQKKSLKYPMPFLSPGVHNNPRKKVGV